jgi:AraC-like DNA-binding protein
MSRLYDTGRDSEGDPLGFWTETVCSQILPVRIDPRQDANLVHSAMRSTSVGALQLREVVGGEHLYERTASDIRRGDPGTLQVGLQVTGSSLLVQDGREAVLGAGDLVLYDSSRPFTLAMDARFSWQVFLLPKDKLRRSDREISALTATTIDASSGVAGLVVRFLRDLAGRADGLELGAAEPELAENAADLVATLVRSQLGRDWRVQDPQRVLLDRALAYISANLREPQLGPERVAHAIGVSVRTLHQLFAGTGRTVGEHVRHERLSAVRRDMSDPRLAGLSIGRLAAGHGFTNASLFSKQFRLAEGCTPREFRDRALRAGDAGTQPGR